MYYGNNIIGYWCFQVFAQTTMSGFHYFLDEFIKTIFINNSLYFVHEDGNTRFKITFIFKPKQKLDF